jgi:hypothetical protein
MAQYYYLTSEPLSFYLDRDGDGKVDWVRCGFDVDEVRRAIADGFQGWMTREVYVSILPINKMDKFDANERLAAAIARGDTENVFNRKITEAQAKQIKKTLKRSPNEFE